MKSILYRLGDSFSIDCGINFQLIVESILNWLLNWAITGWGIYSLLIVRSILQWLWIIIIIINQYCNKFSTQCGIDSLLIVHYILNFFLESFIILIWDLMFVSGGLLFGINYGFYCVYFYCILVCEIYSLVVKEPMI